MNCRLEHNLSRPIPIIHLITTLDVGGAEMMLLKLLPRLDALGFSNQAVSLTNIGPVGDMLLAKGIQVESLGMPRGCVTPGGLIKLKRLLSLKRPAILQTWLYHADLLGLIMGKLYRVKQVCWNIRCTDMELNKYRLNTRITLKICALLSSIPDVVITNSIKAKTVHESLGYKTRHWERIPNGFDTAEFMPINPSKTGLKQEIGISNNPGYADNESSMNAPGIVIGLIARFDPMKDHKTFIEAACITLEQGLNISFVLAGKGVVWENVGLAGLIPRQWKEKFYLLGVREDIQRINCILDIACSSSAFGEGFPNTIGEAMACGVPCVVTDVGDSAMIVGGTGRVVPPR
ncbi:MAG: glycosyltransferase, partial [Thermodesulfobacteriota bacterium]|nr:glycosyltransferase [Thermodesulfobacteriota bacterium]